MARRARHAIRLLCVLATSSAVAHAAPATQPEQPSARRQPLNPDAGKPAWQWQRLTDGWFGLRPEVEARGLVADASFTADAVQNLTGGLNTGGPDVAMLWNLTLTLDLAKLAGVRGGTLFVNAQHAGGDDPTRSVGDFQGISSVGVVQGHRDQVSQVWYEQILVARDDRHPTVRVKLGKVDSNSEFDACNTAGEFLNKSGGSSPTLPGFPSYPDPAFGGLFAVESDAIALRVGVFDGSMQEGKTTGDDGPRSLWSGPSDLIALGEVGYTWSLGPRAGHATLGATYHTGTFDVGAGAHDGAAGYYWVVEQQLTREHGDDASDHQGLAAYVRGAWTDPDTWPARAHVGCGATYTGPLPGRDGDVCGVAVHWVTFGHDPTRDGGDEVNVELFYKFVVTPFCSIKPDVQFVRHPGGVASVDDAVVIGARFDLHF